jgi:hypothetical protein
VLAITISDKGKNAAAGVGAIKLYKAEIFTLPNLYGLDGSDFETLSG